jgi:hypothetical protein
LRSRRYDAIKEAFVAFVGAIHELPLPVHRNELLKRNPAPNGTDGRFYETINIAA